MFNDRPRNNISVTLLDYISHNDRDIISVYRHIIYLVCVYEYNRGVLLIYCVFILSHAHCGVW